MPWIEIITLVATLVKQCFAQGLSEEQAKERIKNPGPWEKWRFETAVRKKMGLSLRDWRDRGQAIMQPIYAELNSPNIDKEADEILQQAKEVNEWEI